MNFKSGRVWPYFIGISITLVFSFCVATIVVTAKADIQESNAYMTHYQDADAKANELIHARILFDKKYKIEYIGSDLKGENSSIKYIVRDVNNKSIDSAKIKLLLSRPETNEFNQELENPFIKDGVYAFCGATFPREGTWNIIAKVNVGEYSRFYNIKADTRNKKFYQY